MAAAADSQAIGTHTLVVEEDLVFLTQHGDYKLGDAQQVNAEVEAVLARLGRVFVLVDQRAAGTTPPDARRCLAEWNKKHKASGAAIFGGSAAARAAATLVLTAVRVFRPDSTPTIFTTTEAEARAWIAAQRTKLLAAGSAPPVFPHRG